MKNTRSKILHLISGLGDGGAQTTLHKIISSEHNYEHVVVNLTSSDKYSRLIADCGVELFELGFRRGRISISELYNLFKVIRSVRPDIIQTWMYHADLLGGILGKLAGVGKIFWNIRHTELRQSRSSLNTLIVSRVCAILSHILPTKIICCANSARKEHERIGYSGIKMITIPNGYDYVRPDLVGASAHREIWNTEEGSFVIGYVARDDPQKDHETLFRALSYVKDKYKVSCFLIGTNITPGNERLIKLLETYSLSDTVKLLGRRDDIIDLMGTLDLHVSSPSFGEGFPNVVAEAMICGTPCIATDVGDAGLIIQDFGWVVQPQQPTELAKAIESAILEYKALPDAWRQRRAACSKRINAEYGIQKMINQYKNVWRG